jgi:hypothetical protein
MLLITAMPILSTGVRDKAAVSSLVPALLHPTANSVLALLELALLLEEVAVHVLLILDLTTVSGSTLSKTTIVTMLMLIPMLDFPLSKVLEDLLVPSALLVPLTPRVLDLKPLSASSILAVDQVAVLNLPSALEESPLSAARRVL